MRSPDRSLQDFPLLLAGEIVSGDNTIVREGRFFGSFRNELSV